MVCLLKKENFLGRDANLELFYRTFLIFVVVGYLYLRITGKKAVAQMHTFDLLYLLILTNIISTPVEVHNLSKAIIYGGTR